MAFHYVELFDALGLDEVILGGVSLGGWIAAEFAVRWPERVKKLWLSGSPGLWVDEEPLPDLFREMTDKDAIRRRLFHDPDGHMAQLVIPDDADEEQMLFVYQAMTVLARLMWERPYDPKLASRLHRIQCPTLLLWGDHDRLVPPAYGEAYKKHLAAGGIEVDPGLRPHGHVREGSGVCGGGDAVLRSSPPHPPLRGRGVGGEGAMASGPRTPHPRPLSPDYRGEGRKWESRRPVVGPRGEDPQQVGHVLAEHPVAEPLFAPVDAPGVVHGGHHQRR